MWPCCPWTPNPPALAPQSWDDNLVPLRLTLPIQFMGSAQVFSRFVSSGDSATQVSYRTPYNFVLFGDWLFTSLSCVAPEVHSWYCEHTGLLKKKNTAFVCVCTCVCKCPCHDGTCVEIRGHICAGWFYHVGRSWVSNSGSQTWLQASLPTKPSHWSYSNWF